MEYTDNCVRSPPALSELLSIQPFDEGLLSSSAPSRYLLDTGSRQFLVGETVYVVISLLLERPSTWELLSQQYYQTTGKRCSVDELRDLIYHKLPPDAFSVVELPEKKKRKGPFLLQLEVFSGKSLSSVTKLLSKLFDLRLVALIVSGFFLMLLLTLPRAMSEVHSSWSASESILLILGLLATTTFHELGHLSACARYGGQHGGMGFAIYFVFPAMYSDVSNAWKLNTKARMLVDSGGLYFQSMTVIVIGSFALFANSLYAYKLVWLVTFAMLHTLNPFFKFDGYWLLSDAAGLTNLHDKVRQTITQWIRCFVRKNDGRHSVRGKRRLQASILYLYILLAGVYLVFVGKFIHSEIARIARDYPSLVLKTVDQIRIYTADGAYRELVSPIVDLSIISVWPFLFVFFCSFTAWVYIKRLAAVVVDLVRENKLHSDGGRKNGVDHGGGQ